MKLILVISALFVLVINKSYAEMYSCSYVYDKKTLSVVFERQENFFIERNSYGNELIQHILYEDKKFLVIGRMAFYDVHEKEFNAFDVIFIDKIKNLYINYALTEPSVRLESNKNTGNCIKH